MTQVHKGTTKSPKKSWQVYLYYYQFIYIFHSTLLRSFFRFPMNFIGGRWGVSGYQYTGGSPVFWKLTKLAINNV